MKFLLLRAKMMKSSEGVSDTDTVRTGPRRGEIVCLAPQCGVKIVIVSMFFRGSLIVD